MVGVKLYVEGGGDTKSLHNECRRGFASFLENAGFRGKMPRTVACGSRQSAHDRFCTAVSSGESALLLIDSEEAIAFGSSPWAHVANRPGDGFSRPNRATDEHCHFMVVCMESWFLADKKALSEYFGPEFNSNALPQNENIEANSKQDVLDGLRKATKPCKPKGTYGKSAHSFKILGTISPDKVKAASPWAKRFLDTLETEMKG